MKKYFVFFIAFFLPFVCSAQNSSLNQKLPVDNTVKVGKLSNGMTYFIKHFSNPKQRGEFYIVHNVGALQEEDDQNGLAHFLEHMAFNGSKNFPGKSMLNYLGSIGVRFGYNVNAYTSKERTVYNISNVPLIREAIIDSVLLALHDWSYYISCEPSEIEAERGVIREEWRLGDNSRSRMMRKASEYQYKGSKYTQRTVIGDTAVINNFVPSTLVNFYHKWYRPDLQAIVLVGDFDVNEMEKKVIAMFSSIPKAENPAPKETYTVPDSKEPIIGIVTDPETKAYAVKLLYKLKGPSSDQKLTFEPIYKNMVNLLILNIFQNKLEEVKEGPNPPFRTSAAVISSGSANLNFVQMTFSPINNDYINALKGVIIQVERAKRFGFSQQDLDLAKVVVSKKLDAAILKLQKRKNEDFVSPIIEHFTNGEALAPEEFKLEKEKEFLEAITIEDINDNVSSFFPNNNRIVLISSPEQERETLPSEKELMQVLNNVDQYTIMPYDTTVEKKELATGLKLKGSQITNTKKWEKYGFTEWTLDNGVKVFWRQDKEPNARMTISAQSKGGYSYVEEKDIPSAKFLEYALRSKWIANLSDKELKLYMSQKDVSLSTSVDLNTESVRGGSSYEDSETLFKLLYLNFTATKIDNQTFVKLLQRQKELRERSADSQINIFRDSIINVKYNNNPYMRPITMQDLDKVNTETVQRIFNERFANAKDFIFFIMGPQEENEIKPLIEKYLGSLPTQNVRESFINRGISLQKGIKEMRYYDQNMLTPKSQISILYHGEMEYNQKNRQGLKLISDILGDRYLKSIREEKGGTYYVAVSASLLSEPAKRAELSVEFETDPNLRDELISIVQNEINDLVVNGPKEEEIKNVILFIKKNFKDREKNSNYWFNRFKDYILDGVDLLDQEEEGVEKIQTTDIQKIASEFFGQSNKFTFIYGTK